MWDSSGQEGVQEDAYFPVESDVVALGPGTWAFTLTADEEWLADPARVYPVYVDPAVWVGPYGPDNLYGINSWGAVSSPYTQVGNSRSAGTDTYWQTILHWPYSAIFPYQVVRAGVYGTYQSGTTNWWGGTLYAASGYCYNCKVYNLQPFNHGGTAEQWIVGYDDGGPVPPLALRLAQLAGESPPSANGLFLFEGTNVAGTYNYKGLRTYLYVEIQGLLRVSVTPRLRPLLRPVWS